MSCDLPSALSAKETGSFAYLTVKDRLPVIVAKIIDLLCREKMIIRKEYGEGASEEIKEIIGLLSKLRSYIQTNKPIRSENFFCDSGNYAYDDREVWRKYIDSYKEVQGEDPEWYSASWLFVECYMYKVIHRIFQRSKHLNNYDPFFGQKAKSCLGSMPSIKQLCEHTFAIISPIQQMSDSVLMQIICNLVQISLWGNQCDLSISAGVVRHQDINILNSLSDQRLNILVCHTEQFWEYISTIPRGKCSFALILDNAGFELVADLCLLTVLTEYDFCKCIYIYPKTRPWYVSDTTKNDFRWTINCLRNEGGDCAELSKLWAQYLQDGRWKLIENSFWTTPAIFPSMVDEDSSLYRDLCSHSLIIFKGDLNYRKLVGDLDWPTNTPLTTALQGFLPASLLILRTIKGGPVVGLDDEAPEVQEAKKKEDWNTSGAYGMIQFVQPL